MKILNKLEEWFLLTGLALMCIIVTTQVIMRFIFRNPLVWSEELARYIFVWIAFIGAAYGVRWNLHIRMDLFYDKFPVKVQKIVSVGANILSIFCFSYLVIYGVKFSISQHGIASAALGIPMSYVFFAVPAGCALTILNLCFQTVEIFSSKNANQGGVE